MTTTTATTSTGAVLAEPVRSTAAPPRTTDPQSPLGPPDRWRPWSRRAATVSISDTPTPDAGRAAADPLLVRLGGLAPGDVDRSAVRASAIEWYLPMAVYLARRFGGRGEPLADLTQVAAIGLIKAVDRYDAGRGVPFASYAFPTILGELKRHFRDSGWNVRTPRRMQELSPRLAVASEELTQVLHRSPTTTELAAQLGVSQDEVLQAQCCMHAYRPISLEQPTPGDGSSHLLDLLGGPDPGIEMVERRETLRRQLAQLPARQQRILALRYDEDLTQAQIATRLGLSQMQISRLLAQSLTQLRDAIHTDTNRPKTGAGPAWSMRHATDDSPADR
jgi:RNA polymerase sigma-B factor